ncbi:probable mediator of RNA polymerase II transcription subunit 26b isoform X2 [Phragmites australis]|uniref:probable mediator of RNA polymerase II transcription subunit 26b isoform X2 n=1 Tax=Phragmites australis TaxID=29695 RepID=UPI002D76FB1C|nr:probable mediator of RNA polymerase II transcription subunit 26b isoform X2 [Phragmites australis]
MAPPSMDYWLGFFRGAGDNIFDAIDAAITIAASDNPGALRARRDGIAERLYTALLVTGATAPVGAAAAPGAAAGTPVTGAPTPAQLLPEGAGSVPSLCSSDRAEAITNDGAPRRGDSVLAETERIKAILLNDQEKSEVALLELLLRLQQLDLTMDTLEVTAIGKAVGNFRKHNSKQIRNLVRSLIEGWKRTVDVYLARCRDAVVDHTPQSMGPSSLEQEERGVASTPMEEGALFATPRTSIQLSEESPGSKFSDGMDEDRSIRNNAGRDDGQQYPMNHEPVRRSTPMGQRYDQERCWRQEQSVIRQSQPQELNNGRPQVRPRPHQDASPAQGRLQSTPSDKPVSHHDENSVRAKLELAKNAKLEATKRKLQEGYQEFDNAKKQRTIQMVDPQNLPKQGNRNFQPSGKPRNNSNRNWSR